jgi:hypothetical protein
MFTNMQDVLTFALAGHAKLTLSSLKTGARYTFQINQAKDRATGERQKRWFVSLLSGPDNNSDYQYVGMITEDHQFVLTKASRFAADSLPVRGFNFFWQHAGSDRMPPQMEIRHSGHCGRCGRTLTVPESIDSGIGPICMGLMQAGQ